MNKKFLLIVFLSLVCFLTGCFDLGTYGDSTYNDADLDNIEEYFKDYYDTFGTIRLFTQDKSKKSFSLKDSFFNTSTVNDLTWEDDDDKVDTNEYIYMAIEVEKDFELDSLSLYMKGDNSLKNSVNMEIYLYVLDKYSFSKVPCYSDSLIELDGDNKPVYENDGVTPKKVSYDFMDKATASGSATITLNGSEFDSFTIDKFNGSDTKKITDGQYIILSFYNNTAYGKAENLTKVSFTALNLLIRAV